jgi:hypothetical protein
MALSKDEEDAFRAWLASQGTEGDDDPDDTPEEEETDPGEETEEGDDQEDDDEDPGVTLKAGGVLIYQGRTYQRVKDKPVKRAPARKRTPTTGTPPRKKTAVKAPAKDPNPGGGSKRQLFT